MFRTAHPTDRVNGAASSSSSSSNHAATTTIHPTFNSKLVKPKYQHRLNFYSTPPTSEVTIEEFETWAIDRLKVLAEIESSSARNRSYAETKEVINSQLKRYLPLSANTAASKAIHLDLERRKDHVSHFVLRLAFCRSEELRRRFVKAETTLFRIRFETDDTLERESFLKTLNFDWQAVTLEEKNFYREQLVSVSPRIASTFESETFFKVHWTRVTDLVERRRVFVRGGVAWVPMKEQSSLVLAEFQSRLSRDLELTAKALPRLDEDDRLLPVLSHLSMGFMAGISNDYYANASIAADGETVITADMVDSLIKRHAPMCMRNLHEQLEEKHHLRHYARLQYNLFLKELGLPIEEALIFWRRSFSGITDDKFNKEYRYNIRHGYGLEGRRLNYPAKSCARILTQDQPGPQDNHGCPFRHFSPQNLSSALSRHYSLSVNEQSEILSAVKQGHYHVGCTRLFELTHSKLGVKKGEGLGNGESVSHPNRYFERSWSKFRQVQGEGEVVRLEGEDSNQGEEKVKEDGDHQVDVEMLSLP
ncbi:DNA primase large subunit [Violaceomyces palustris]|uniref:DNA primase large subunit n=1 Tax=Violaceomyces palustris TaxID=1673888 RepID=A0ACD0NR67_9BASI|nr:DNA primase large subunit [Violaceomyces palustris]